VIVEPSRSFLGSDEVAAVLRLWLATSFLGVEGIFSLFSLSFSSLGASFFGCFQPFWFFQMPFPSFCFVGALYVAWVFFTWVYFLLELFFFYVFKYLQEAQASLPAAALRPATEALHTRAQGQTAKAGVL
jgi:hypothetical protein